MGSTLVHRPRLTLLPSIRIIAWDMPRTGIYPFNVISHGRCSSSRRTWASRERGARRNFCLILFRLELQIHAQLVRPDLFSSLQMAIQLDKPAKLDRKSV